MFGKLGLPHGKKTKSGWSTNADVLEELRLLHPVVDKVLRYRTVAKLKSTYCDGLLKVIGPDGRVHSTFNQTETRTGRISSGEPNLQNIPVRTELGSRFRNPSAGGAIYHESNYTAGRWRFTAGLRFDFEHARLHYRSNTETGYTATDRSSGTSGHYPLAIDIRSTLKQSFTEVLPKFSVLYAFDEIHNLYVSVAKGYKAGGFNTQMFSDVLQQEMMREMGFGAAYDVDKVVSYKPEYSWNYEFGGHFSCMDGAVRGDFALFWIDCRDQQLTVFPEGTTTGRMMTNAGRTRSLGGELSLQISPWRNLDINAAYGYTDARFVRYNDGKQDFKDNRLPYAPQHTLGAGAAWTVPTGVSWLGNIVLRAGMRCAGRIWWNEENTLSQPFYALAEASVRFEQKHYSVDIWGRNLGGEKYDVFYFKSIGNEFVQRGRPRTFGITLNINL